MMVHCPFACGLLFQRRGKRSAIVFASSLGRLVHVCNGDPQSSLRAPLGSLFEAASMSDVRVGCA